MAFFASIAASWKYGVYGLLAAALLIGGWQANSWRHRAYEADRLESALILQRKATDLANAARAMIANELAQADTQTVETTREVVKKVKVYVPVNPDCNLSSNVIGMLNGARGIDMPAAAVNPVDPNPSP